MSNDFYQSEAFRELMEAIQEKYGTIESFTVCHSFESPEYLEYLATVKEEDEQLEVEYPSEGPDSFMCDDTEYHRRYLDGVIPVYEQYHDPWYLEYEDTGEEYGP